MFPCTSRIGALGRHEACNRRSESYVWQGHRSIHIRRETYFTPIFRLTVASCLGFLRVSNGVAPQQEMERQMFARRQTKNHLSHFGGRAHFISPVRFQCRDRCPDGRLVIRKQFRCVLIRPAPPVGPHSAGFEGAHLNTKRSYLLGKRFGESANRPFGGVIRRTAGPGDTAATTGVATANQ